MRFIIQRVSHASVTVNSEVKGKIEEGFLVLIGIENDDTEEIADKMIAKMIGLRIFQDEEGKMNLSLKQINGGLLLVSQFTLYADCRRGNRPSFSRAGKPDKARDLYEYIIEKCKAQNVPVEQGIFGAEMKVELLNDGPVTIFMDSNELIGNENKN